MSTSLPFQCNSPAGMGQLIKYFESQSKRLDKQAINPQGSCLSSDFESMIRFSGVPILPPAITPSRREELRQLKKNAILLEKRLKARQRRHPQSKGDNFTAEPKMMYPETSPRPAARQLNFDHEADREEHSPERYGANNPVSTFATAETGLDMEDFGLQTMDSVNSDFMSMEQASIPRVFAGLALTSFKEQKISYDLDRLSKVLNVQDMASTSGSDLSDALGNTQALVVEEDLQDAQKLAQKFLHANSKASDGRGGQTAAFFHESQDTVVEVSPEAGGREDSSTSGFVDNTNSSNLEQTQTSLGSSPGCGSANTMATSDSQRSNRSSPKSLKNGVHFASFLTEYNTTTSQLFERPMIVKKKMPYEQSVDLLAMPNIPMEGATPIIGDPSETRQRGIHKGGGDAETTNALLYRVAFNPDSDSSPLTPPFDATSGVPFQSYGKSEPYSSDKENDASHSLPTFPQSHKKSPDQSGRLTHASREQGGVDLSHRWAAQRRILEQETHSTGSPEAGGRGGSISDESRRRGPVVHGLPSQHHSLPVSGATSGIGPHELPARTDHVGATPISSSSLLHKDEVALSTSATLTSGLVTVGQNSVSDSQGSNRSATLTGTSESSSSTIKDDLSAQENGSLAMNIVVAGHGSVNIGTTEGETEMVHAGPACEDGNGGSPNLDKMAPQSTKSGDDVSHSPKKLNTDYNSPSVGTAELEQDIGAETPPQKFVRKGSYTLNEPSPALLKARARHQQEISDKQACEKEQQRGETDTTVTVIDSTLATAQTSKKSQLSAGGQQRVQRKLPTVSKGNSKPHPQGNTSGLTSSTEAEREGKAEHISRYLSQVQFQNSMNLSCQSWDGPEHSSGPSDTVSAIHREEAGRKDCGEEDLGGEDITEQVFESVDDGGNGVARSSILEVLRSVAESVQGGREPVSVAKLLSDHQEQMDRERQNLINQQQRDMEELFVQQRRDMLLLEAEIKAAQQMEKDQQEFLIQNLPENIKVQARHHEGEFSPEHTGTFHAEGDGGGSANISSQLQSAVHSLDNRRPQSLQHRPSMGGISGHDGEFSLHLQPKSFPRASGAKVVQKAKKTSPYPLVKKGSRVSPYSPQSAWEESQTQLKTVADGSSSSSPRSGPPPAVPNSTPSLSSPRIHHQQMPRSHKFAASRNNSGGVVIPPEAYAPQMQAKFERVSAVAKGFLTRCLLRSDKVQELIKTIKDTREFAFSFQTETPVKRGVFTPQDRALLERIVAQLQAALLDIHEIFFEVPCAERMALIEQTRVKEHDKRVKMSRDSLRGSGPRISQATLKALERKRKAKEAEASVTASLSSRPRTAPPTTSSPRCQNHTDLRALKPLQGQSHHRSDVSSAGKHDSSRSDKERPQTAPPKQLTRPKRITAMTAKHMNTSSTTSSAEANKDASKDGSSKASSTVATRVVAKSKSASVKPVSSRPGKSWR